MLGKLVTLIPRWLFAEHEAALEEYRHKPILWKQWIVDIVILLVILIVILL